MNASISIVPTGRRQWVGLWLTVMIGIALSAATLEGADLEKDGKRWDKVKSDWFSWVMPWGDDLKLDTALNMSRRLDGPAGKHGFVRSQGPSFVFEDGTPARFWGACIGYQENMPAVERAAVMADWIAFNGWNCVREHFYQHIFHPEYQKTTPAGDHSAPDPVQLDRFDRLNAELKKRGIYYHWVPFINAKFNEKDGAIKGVRPAICFDEMSFRLQQRFLEQMLSHRNPYTGLRYVDDPALVAIELVNEDDFRATEDWSGYYAPELWQELLGLWHNWLKEQYGDDAGLRAAWSDVELGEDESLAAGTVRLPATMSAENFDSRQFDERRFCGWIELRYVRRMEEFLRKLGLRVPVAQTNALHGYYQLKVMAQAGFSGAHTYHSHPHGWSPTKLSIWSHLSGGFGGHRCERYMNQGHTANVPNAVSEINASAPGDFRHEVVFTTAAHASLQDYDMVLWFISFGYGQDYADPATRTVRDPFHINFDAARIGPMPAASLMVLRGDVSPAKNIVELVANDAVQRQLPQNLTNRIGKPNNYHLPGLDWVPFLTGQQINFTPEQLTPGAIVLNPDPALELNAPNHTVLTGPHDQLSAAVQAELSRRSADFALTGRGSGVSDTGQLTYDRRAGVMTIDTPRTQAVVGNLGSGKRSLSNVSFQFANDAATVAVSSLDDRPLASSRRMLVSCVADAANRGMEIYVPADTPDNGHPERYLVKNWAWPAKEGMYCQPVVGTLSITFEQPPPDVTVYRLDSAGRRMGQVPTQLEQATVTFKPSAEHQTLYYELVVGNDEAPED